MEIKTFIPITIVLASCLTVLAAPKNEKVPHAVGMFISNLEKLSQLSDNQRDDAYNLNEQNIHYFAAGGNSKGGITIDSDQKFNSELYYLGLGSVSNSLTYCNKLYVMLYKEKELKLKHEILYTEAINVLDIHGKDELYFYDTKLKKICEYNNQIMELWQTFEVNASNGLIVKIEGYTTMPANWRRGRTDKSVKKSMIQQSQISTISNSLENKDAMDEQEYLRLAARYYTAKDYAAAGETYKQLTTVYPNNAEGWFRLALIVKYKTKWSKKIYKNPVKSAIEFMNKAKNLAVGELKSKAENALFYWEHPNYM